MAPSPEEQTAPPGHPPASAHEGLESEDESRRRFEALAKQAAVRSIQGATASHQGAYASAIRLLTSAMGLSAETHDAPGVARIAIELARAYAYVGLTNEARALADGAVIWLQAIGSMGHQLAEALNLRVDVETKAGIDRLPPARRAQLEQGTLEAHALFRAGGCAIGVARSLLDLAILHSSARNLDIAEYFYQQSLNALALPVSHQDAETHRRLDEDEFGKLMESLAQFGGSSQRFAVFTRSTCDVAMDDGGESARSDADSMRGQIWFFRAQDAVEAQDWAVLRACVHRSYDFADKLWWLVPEGARLLGRAAFHEDDLKKSRRHFGEALAVFSARGDELQEARVHAELGVVADAQGDYLGALQHLLAAAGGFNRLRRYDLSEMAYRTLAVVMASYGEATAEAWADLGAARVGGSLPARRTALQRAVARFGNARDWGGLAAANHLLAQIERAAGDIGLGLEHAIAAMRHIQRLRAEQGSQWLKAVPSVSADVIFREVLQMLAEGQLGESLGGFEALEAVEALRGHRMAGLLHRRVTVSLADDAATTTHNVNLIRDLLASRGAPSLARPGSSRADPERARLDEPGVLEAVLEQAVRDAEGVVGRLASLSAPEPVNIDRLVEVLESIGAEVLLYDLDSTAPDGWVLSTVWWDSERRWPELHRCDVTGDARTLMNRFQAADVALLEGGMWSPWMMEQLCRLLVPDSLRARLEHRATEGAPPATLLIVVPGSLWRVPFAALHLGGRPIADFATVTVTASLRALPPAGGGEQSEGAVAFLAGEVFNEQQLRRLFNPLTVVRERDSLLDGLAIGRSTSLAIIDAPHGHDTDGLAHGLHLGAGQHLTAADLIGRDLPAGLVFGPCWTAGASAAGNEEPIGMATVALSQGARWVLGSLWPIYPGPARALYVDFLEGLRALGPQESLRRAQLAAYQRAPERLCDWAAHVVIGAPAPFEPGNRTSSVSGE